VISYNGRSGVALVGEPALRNHIFSNEIFANGLLGIKVEDASQNVIRGNRVHENAFEGVGIGTFETPTGANQNSVVANVIKSNGSGGVEIFNAKSNLIGGTGNQIGPPIIGNRITDNTDDGVVVEGPLSDNNFIQANVITGNSRDGVFVGDNSTNTLVGGTLNTTIGGACTGQCNQIKKNGLYGVGVSESAESIQILSNSITANAFDGIASGEEFVPALSLARVKGDKTKIKANVHTAVPGQGLYLEFFQNAVCDDVGSGEGKTWIGSFNVATDAFNGNGEALVNFTLSYPAGEGLQITATQTNPSTKETGGFSNCIPVTVKGSCSNRCCPGHDNSCIPPGESCYCDDFCLENGDCCSDFVAECK
jgi:parallel beta-helix repeat protein